MKGLTIILLCLCFFSYFSGAQITEVEIGVNGLTCSQCSRTVEMRIRKLSFVKNVEMNLEHTEGKILFKNGAQVNIDKIAQAVNDAGFSVRYLQASFTFDHIDLAPSGCFEFDKDNYVLINTQKKELKGTTTLKFIGKKFLPKKDFDKWQPYMKNSCAGNNSKVYFVTM